MVLYWYNCCRWHDLTWVYWFGIGGYWRRFAAHAISITSQCIQIYIPPALVVWMNARPSFCSARVDCRCLGMGFSYRRQIEGILCRKSNCILHIFYMLQLPLVKPIIPATKTTSNGGNMVINDQVFVTNIIVHDHFLSGQPLSLSLFVQTVCPYSKVKR